MPYAKIESSGCGIVKDVTKLRIDCFLNETDPYYERHYVYVPDPKDPKYIAGYPGLVDAEGMPLNQKDYDAWLESLTHIWQNNPFHSHKIWLPDAGATDNYIKEQIERTLNYFYTFHQEMWDTGKKFIDEWKKVPKVKGSIRDIFVKGDPKDSLANQTKVANILSRQADFWIGKTSIIPPPLDIGEKGTIDVGTIPDDFNTAIDILAYTTVEAANPALADGEIDTVLIWMHAVGAGTDVYVGTFSASGDDLTCYDSESIGQLEAGENSPITGLHINILTDHYIGLHVKSGSGETKVEGNNSGGSGIWYKPGDYIDPTDTVTFSFLANFKQALYGTGTESGGGEDYPINLSVGLTASVSIDRDVAYHRALTPGLTAAVSLARAVAYHRASSTALAISTTIARSWGRTISTATALSVATSILKGWGRTITTSTALSVSTTISKSVAFKRATSTALSVATTISAIYSGVTHYLITTATALTASVSISRAVTYTRASQTALSVAVSVAKQVAYNRVTSAALAVSTTISRALTYARATASNLSASVTVARSVAYNRAVSAGLSISVSIWASIKTLVGKALTFFFSSKETKFYFPKQSVTLYFPPDETTLKMEDKDNG